MTANELPMFPALTALQQLVRRIDEKRAPYVLIAAGVVYFVAFNTVFREVNNQYLGFLLLVMVLCKPFLLRPRGEPTLDEGGPTWPATPLHVDKEQLKENRIMDVCSQCGTEFQAPGNFCAICGAPKAYPHRQQYSPPQTSASGNPQPIVGSHPHHVAAKGFAQTFGVHPAVASLTIIVDLMMNFGTAATFGALWVATIPVGIVLGTIAFLAQKKWYGDDNESAFIKALIVALLTAIPAPVSPLLIPSGIAGVFRRKKD